MKICGVSAYMVKTKERREITAGIVKNTSKTKKMNMKERKTRHPQGLTVNSRQLKTKVPLSLSHKTQYDHGEVEKLNYCPFDFGFSKSTSNLKQTRILGQLEADALLSGKAFFPSQTWSKING